MTEEENHLRFKLSQAQHEIAILEHKVEYHLAESEELATALNKAKVLLEGVSNLGIIAAELLKQMSR
jgi:hypothetical protein